MQLRREARHSGISNVNLTRGSHIRSSHANLTYTVWFPIQISHDCLPEYGPRARVHTSMWASNVEWTPGVVKLQFDSPKRGPEIHGFRRFGLYWHYKPTKTVHFAHWRVIIIGVKWNLTREKAHGDSHMRFTCETLMWASHVRFTLEILLGGGISCADSRKSRVFTNHEWCHLTDRKHRHLNWGAPKAGRGGRERSDLPPRTRFFFFFFFFFLKALGLSEAKKRTFFHP